MMGGMGTCADAGDGLVQVHGSDLAGYRRLCGYPRPDRCLAWARRWRRNELSRVAAMSVIAMTAIGAGKLRIWATNWSRATPTAQTMIVAAAQAMAR